MKTCIRLPHCTKHQLEGDPPTVKSINLLLFIVFKALDLVKCCAYITHPLAMSFNGNHKPLTFMHYLMKLVLNNY